MLDVVVVGVAVVIVVVHNLHSAGHCFLMEGPSAKWLHKCGAIILHSSASSTLSQSANVPVDVDCDVVVVVEVTEVVVVTEDVVVEEMLVVEVVVSVLDVIMHLPQRAGQSICRVGPISMLLHSDCTKILHFPISSGIPLHRLVVVVVDDTVEVDVMEVVDVVVVIVVDVVVHGGISVAIGRAGFEPHPGGAPRIRLHT